MVDVKNKLKELDIQNSVGLLIRTTSKSLEKALGEKLKRELNLTGSKWKVLVALTVENGISQTRLADLIFVEGPTLVSVLDKLEELGLVERRPDPKDRRNNLIFMTKKSQNLIGKIIDCILELRKTITKNVSDKDLEITKNVLRQMTKDADHYYQKMRDSN